MSDKNFIQHSVLIVTASGQFDAAVRQSLKASIVETRKNAAAARRYVLERYYDLIVINAPLPDEPGDRLALDIAEQCSASVLLVVPSEVFEDFLEHVTDQGILVISKPIPRGRLDKSIRFLFSVQNRIRKLQKKVETAEEKLEELRIVNRAKLLLVEKQKMTEDEAHRYIGRQAMNSGISRRRAADRIIEDLE